MKKNVYITLLGIITFVCITVGIIINCGFSNYIPFFKDIILNESVSKTEIEDEFNKITLEGSVMDFEVEEGDCFAVKLKCKNMEIPKVEVVNKELKITQKEKNKISFGNKECKVTVIIPEETEIEDADINVDVGNAKVNTGKYKNIKMNVNVGNVECEHISFESGDMSTDVGNAEVDTCKIDTLKISSSTGNIKLENGSFKEIHAKSDIGNVKITPNMDLSDFEIHAEADTGKVTYNGDKVNGGQFVQNGKNGILEANASCGNVKIE